MDRTNFSYSVTVTAPKEYPVEVHEGWLADNKKEFICAVSRVGRTYTDWVTDGADGAQGGDVMPAHLNFTYIAYAEKKFYNVDADLPTAKILEEFRKGFMVKGYPDNNGVEHIVPGTYDTFTVAAAPGGVIVVFLSAGHHRVEICRLQAKEVYVDKNDFTGLVEKAETQQEFLDDLYRITVPDSIKTIIKEKGIPYGLWDKYREKFKYRFVLKPYDGKDKFTFESHEYFNGEANILYPQDLEKNEYMTAAIPYHVNLSFTVYNTEITFNDQEMLKVFEDFKKSDPGKPMDIIIKPTFQYNDMKVSVKCGDKEIPLEKYKVEGVWSND
ncbi:MULTISPECIES: DUF2931 family protein [unclassified Chryseobacterium]|uniref:DUF2931 family protein n=1 Tax=unclassified Chryseobacterium TaxID=2593645 RepID=UPI002269BA42|nr:MULTISPECIES: DUF2931 family protein [unclassified Chryseobacterium]